MLGARLLVVSLVAAGCAPKLLVSELDPVKSELRLPDWTEPWNGDTLVVATAAVEGTTVTARPSREQALVRVRYRWEQTPLGKDYLVSLGCDRPRLTIESAEQAICDRAKGHYFRDVEFRWDRARHAWLAARVAEGQGAERRAD